MIVKWNHSLLNALGDCHIRLRGSVSITSRATSQVIKNMYYKKNYIIKFERKKGG